MPVGGGAWASVHLARLVAGGGAVDPAWGCGRTVPIPPLCAPGFPCPGSYGDDHLVTGAGALASRDGSIVVIGNQWRRDPNGEVDAHRGFIARVRP